MILIVYSTILRLRVPRVICRAFVTLPMQRPRRIASGRALSRI